MFQRAAEFRAENTTYTPTLAAVEAHFATRRGFAVVPWEGDAALEAQIKERTGATLRCLPMNLERFRDLAPGDHPSRGARSLALFARAY
jgi:prolyl-tRNA synthetase